MKNRITIEIGEDGTTVTVGNLNAPHPVAIRLLAIYVYGLADADEAAMDSILGEIRCDCLRISKESTIVRLPGFREIVEGDDHA